MGSNQNLDKSNTRNILWWIPALFVNVMTIILDLSKSLSHKSISSQLSHRNRVQITIAATNFALANGSIYIHGLKMEMLVQVYFK